MAKLQLWADQNDWEIVEPLPRGQSGERDDTGTRGPSEDNNDPTHRESGVKGSVRIVRKPLSKWGKRFWYSLEVVSSKFAPGTRLQSTTATQLPNQRRGRKVVDPVAEQAAIATLTAWAGVNGWRVIE
jgi:hypothetical protein